MLSIYRLPNSLPEERIIKVVRRSFFIFLKNFLLILFLAFLYVGVLLLLVNTQFIAIDSDIIFALLVLATGTYYLFLTLFLFYGFMDYYLDVWIITNERIVDIRQNGFFNRTISEQRISRVQDVTSSMTGVWATILNFGDVHVQTAGERERFLFEQVSHPDAVRNLIIKIIDEKGGL